MDPLLSTDRDQWKGRKDRSKISINFLKISQKINSLYSINKYIYFQILQIKIITNFNSLRKKISKERFKNFSKKFRKYSKKKVNSSPNSIKKAAGRRTAFKLEIYHGGYLNDRDVSMNPRKINFSIQRGGRSCIKVASSLAIDSGDSRGPNQRAFFVRVRADVSPLHASTSAEGKSKSFGTCGLTSARSAAKEQRARERERKTGRITRRARRKIKTGWKRGKR